MGFESILASGIITYILLLAPFPLIALAIPYAILRYRDSRSERPDPQLGIKAALYFFFSLGIVLFLEGLTIIVVDLLLETRQQPPGQGLTPNQRSGLGMIVAGLVVTLLHLVLVKTMTDDRAVATRRIFAGARLALHGMIVVIAFTALLVIVFQKDFGPKEVRKALFGVLLVWIPSWILHLVLVSFYSRRLYEPSRSGIGFDDRDRDRDR
jgi:hypothetical protein